VFNPIVRSKLTAVHETSSKAMKYDINHLADMNDEQLMGVLKEMQVESERIKDEEPADDPATDYLRAKLATIRKNVRQFQAQQHAGPAVVGGAKDAETIGEMLTEQSGESPSTVEQSPPTSATPPFETI
jgi:hypothetical protein